MCIEMKVQATVELNGIAKMQIGENLREKSKFFKSKMRFCLTPRPVSAAAVP